MKWLWIVPLNMYNTIRHMLKPHVHVWQTAEYKFGRPGFPRNFSHINPLSAGIHIWHWLPFPLKRSLLSHRHDSRLALLYSYKSRPLSAQAEILNVSLPRGRIASHSLYCYPLVILRVPVPVPRNKPFSRLPFRNGTTLWIRPLYYIACSSGFLLAGSKGGDRDE